MIILAISDIHGDAAGIERLGPELAGADLALVSGDITNFGGRREAEAVLDRLARHARRVLAVPGNCDRSEVGAVLAERGMSLDCRTAEAGGAFFAGVGGAVPGPVPTPYEHSDEELKDLLAQTAAGIPPGYPLVLLCHQPPHATAVDMVCGGRHVGSRALRAFIEERKPLACFCGHIHESPGLDRIGETAVCNPGPLARSGYARAEWKNGKLTVEAKSLIQPQR